MNNIISLRNMKELPFIIVKNGIVMGISKSFSDITEYSSDEFMNKEVKEIFCILKIGPRINLENVDENTDYFLFNRSFEVRFINIEVVKEINEQIYILREKPNSRFEDKYNYLCQLLSQNIYGIAIYSVPDFILLKANQMYLDDFTAVRNTYEYALGKQGHDIVIGWKDNHVDDILRKLIENGKAKHIKEFKYDKLEKGITYWDTTITPLFDGQKIKYIVVNLNEVTESVITRKQLEERNEVIEQQKKELEAILDNMIDGFSIFNADGNYIRTNKMVKQWVKEMELDKSEDALGKIKAYDLNGKEFTKSELPDSRVLNGEKIDQVEILIKFNEIERYLSISGTPIYDENGNFIMGLLNLRDITESKIQSQVMKQQKELLEAIIRSMSDGLELVNNKMEVTLLNQSAKDFFYKADTRVKTGDSLKYNKYYYGIDGKEMPFKELPTFKIFNAGNFENYIITIDRPDKKVYASVTGSQIYNGNSNVKEAILCIRNITEQVMHDKLVKYHQETALRAEKEKNEALKKSMEMKDEFLSLISHEFRTPLNVISTAIQAINYICKDDLSDKAKDYIRMIKQNTYRQLRLVNNLLDITRANVGCIKLYKRNIDIVFMTKAITESIYTYASQKGVKLTFKALLKKKIIGIDDEKYERILLNLLSNAIKFTPEGKSVIVELCNKNNSICVEVRDTGIGIPDDKLDTIFERFGQVDSSLSRQAEGAGIGLSLVKRFVEALNGSISVKSKMGEGSCFTILLPSERVIEEHNKSQMIDLLDNRLAQVSNIEFSDIYLK